MFEGNLPNYSLVRFPSRRRQVCIYFPSAAGFPLSITLPTVCSLKRGYLQLLAKVPI